MIEKTILDFLKTKGIRAYMERVDGITKDFVLIEKIGSSEENFIKHATIAIQSYSNSLYNAALLNEKVKDTMKQMIELNEISKCSLNSDYNFTIPDKKEYRYQAVFDLVYL